jgi:hypothetical protein
MSPVFSRNNSQNAGCMRRSSASHCCHVLSVLCTTAAAAVWDSPSSARAARISAGSGLLAGLATPLRFGWLGNLKLFAVEFGRVLDHVCVKVRLVGRPLLLVHPLDDVVVHQVSCSVEVDRVAVEHNSGTVHFYLQPLVPRRGGFVEPMNLNIRALSVCARTIFQACAPRD